MWNRTEHYEVRSMKETSILDLPDVAMTKIFSLLSPPELGLCAQVCHLWNRLVYEPSLWQRVCPVQWALGQWTYDPNWNTSLYKLNFREFHELGLGIIVTGGQLEGEVEPKRYANMYRRIAAECRVMSGLVRYALSRVGGGVKELYLGASCILNDTLFNAMLLQCPNVTALDVSHTSLSSAAFHGINENGSCRLLRNVSFAGCERLEDSAIISLTECWKDEELWNDELIDSDVQRSLSSVAVKSTSMSEQDLLDTVMCIAQQQTVPRHQEEPLHVLYTKCRRRAAVQGLRALDLSGCCRLTDHSINHLAKLSAATRQLKILDLSGCFQLTAHVLNDFVRSCPSLCPDQLSYCDNIVDGPYSREANGCNNLQCTQRICCTPLE